MVGWMMDFDDGKNSVLMLGLICVNSTPLSATRGTNEADGLI
jgi:hypothetical protein